MPMFGFWQLSNRQMFDNVINAKAFQKEHQKFEHTILSSLEFGPSLLVFCFFVAVLIFVICLEVRHQYNKYSEEDEVEELTEVEGYPDYPLCLEPKDVENVCKEDELC